MSAALACGYSQVSSRTRPPAPLDTRAFPPRLSPDATQPRGIILVNREWQRDAPAACARGNREGFALAAAILGVLVITAIISAGYYAASSEEKVSASVSRSSDAFYIAETGLATVVSSKTLAFYKSLPDTHMEPAVPVEVSGREIGQYTVTIRRLSPSTYFIMSEGRATNRGRDSLAVRRLGAVTRLASLSLPTSGALTVFGAMDAAGQSKVRGTDNPMPGCTAAGDTSAVVAPNAGQITQGGNAEISGSPNVEENASLDTAMLSDYGPLDLAELMELADYRYTDPNGTVVIDNAQHIGPKYDADGSCVASDSTNWGETTLSTTCSSHFPIVHVDGDLDIRVASGQGILIVDGDLIGSGNFDFYGIVIVTGDMTMSGTGNHIEGSTIVMGGGDLNSANTTQGDALIQYSSCRVQAAIDGNMRAIPLSKRSWTDLSAAQ